MSFFYVLNNHSAEFFCPYCKQGFNVSEWNTDSEGPESCSEIIECPECKETFEVWVQTRLSIDFICEKVS